MELKGATAIITGGSRGIGRAIAIALAKRGVSIAAAARNMSSREGTGGSLEGTVQEIKDLGGQAEAILCDVAKEGDVDHLIQATMKRFGRIDILVNNAAFLSTGFSLLDCPVESWDLTFKVNVRGAFLCIQKALPSMIKAKKGNIINITSIAAIRAPKGRIAYSASKAALDRLTYGLAQEVKEYNIAVNALCPIAMIDTPGVRDRYPDKNFDEMGKPEDVAEAAAWLAGQDAGTFTGRAFTVPPRGKFNIIVYGKMSDERMFVTIK